MILQAGKKGQRGHRGTLVNLDTMQAIRWARWADLQSGEYEAFSIDPDAAKKAGLNPKAFLYRGRARLKWIPREQPVYAPVGKPLAEDRRRDGVEQYREAFVKVWLTRGLCRVEVEERWVGWKRRHEERRRARNQLNSM